MNRRGFFSIIGGSIAALLAPKIDLVPPPVVNPYEGFVFIKDPYPMRFIWDTLKGTFVPIERFMHNGVEVRTNPAYYRDATHELEISIHPDVLAKREIPDPEDAHLVMKELPPHEPLVTVPNDDAIMTFESSSYFTPKINSSI